MMARESRWNVVQSKIQELSDQVTELSTKNSNNAAQIQELLHNKSTLEEALASQAAQLQRLASEYMSMRNGSVSNTFLPSRTLQFDPSEDVVLKYPTTTTDGCAEHVLLPSSDIQQCAYATTAAQL
jgi:predicted nuclease with TOPRIM domain